MATPMLTGAMARLSLGTLSDSHLRLTSNNMCQNKAQIGSELFFTRTQGVFNQLFTNTKYGLINETD